MSVHAMHQEPMQAPVQGRGFLPAAEMAKREALARFRDWYRRKEEGRQSPAVR